eukprot:Gb_37784 [translate_table: standard]
MEGMQKFGVDYSLLKITKTQWILLMGDRRETCTVGVQANSVHGKRITCIHRRNVDNGTSIRGIIIFEERNAKAVEKATGTTLPWEMDVKIFLRTSIIQQLSCLQLLDCGKAAVFAPCSNESCWHSYFPYLFMKTDAEKAAAKTYDYIVVGGGTAGCPIAATLSQHFSVLVVERGGSPYGVPNIEDKSALVVAMKEIDEYTRASLDYIRDMGWDENLVNESYEWIEKELVFRRDLGPWQSAFKEALLDVGVTLYNGYTMDHVEGTKITASIFDNNRKRHTAADLLKHANADNIVVLLHATTSRILFYPPDNHSGVELKFVAADGASHQVFLKESSKCCEIIVSGERWVAWGEAWQTVLLPQPPCCLPYHSNNIDLGLWVLLTILRSSSNPSASSRRTPRKQGEHHRARRNMLQPFSKRFNYYSHPQDLEKGVQGARILAKLYESKPLLEFGDKNSSNGIPELQFIGHAPPKSKSVDATVVQFCRNALTTFYHNHGGCHIGSVINDKYEVVGIDGLRVVDAASTFNHSPGTNPQATIMMLGSYCGYSKSVWVSCTTSLIRTNNSDLGRRFQFINKSIRETQVEGERRQYC